MKDTAQPEQTLLGADRADDYSPGVDSNPGELLIV
jgi:hypothetical protein